MPGLRSVYNRVRSRRQAIERLLSRAFGRVVTPVEASGDTTQTVRYVHTVRWLPPDPADTSKYIEPEQD